MLLWGLGGSWLNPWAIRDAPVQEDRQRPLHEVWSEVRQRGSQVLKDPRLCVTLPWWQGIWEPELPVSYVLLFRHPTEVAASLAARDALPAVLAEALWVEYTRSALNYTRGRSRALLFHHDLITDPDDAVEKVLKQLALESGYSGVGSVQELVRTDLYHQRKQTTPLLVQSQVLWEKLSSPNLSDVECQLAQATSEELRQGKSLEVVWAMAGTHYAAGSFARRARIRDARLTFFRRNLWRLASRVLDPSPSAHGESFL